MSLQEKTIRILQERLENARLLELAESRSGSGTTAFEDFVKEEGVTVEELEKLSESVEIE